MPINPSNESQKTRKCSYPTPQVALAVAGIITGLCLLSIALYAGVHYSPNGALAQSKFGKLVTYCGNYNLGHGVTAGYVTLVATSLLGVLTLTGVYFARTKKSAADKQDEATSPKTIYNNLKKHIEARRLLLKHADGQNYELKPLPENEDDARQLLKSLRNELDSGALQLHQQINTQLSQRVHNIVAIWTALCNSTELPSPSSYLFELSDSDTASITRGSESAYYTDFLEYLEEGYLILKKNGERMDYREFSKKPVAADKFAEFLRKRNLTLWQLDQNSDYVRYVQVMNPAHILETGALPAFTLPDHNDCISDYSDMYSLNDRDQFPLSPIGRRSSSTEDEIRYSCSTKTNQVVQLRQKRGPLPPLPKKILLWEKKMREKFPGLNAEDYKFLNKRTASEEKQCADGKLYRFDENRVLYAGNFKYELRESGKIRCKQIRKPRRDPRSTTTESGISTGTLISYFDATHWGSKDSKRELFQTSSEG